ncbi:formylmethanofuran dehydrogenase subunit E family protein [Flavobacterium sp. RSB2_4_14]|uniref:formylmethanofuran dehydrogenase subunit E family protein n=1 Tax=Flavobacterium sp. RSB2_4_14 TaxID=3447665 RepID=UPI003F3016A4
MKKLVLLLAIILSSCVTNNPISFKVIDTDFSKGRVSYEQNITLKDLEKFHGHLCDGLVVGALAMQQGMKILYPNQAIDRTNLRIVSKPSPCLTDVAIYITGGRYQFQTFYVEPTIPGVYVVQRIDTKKTVSISIKKDVIPREIDSLGNLAVQQKLSSCELKHLKKLEDDFITFLLKSNPEPLFTVTNIEDFDWQPNSKNDYLKTDILNKNLPKCNN